MRYYKYIGFLVILLFIVSLGCLYIVKRRSVAEKNISDQLSDQHLPIITLQPMFYDQSNFETAIQFAENSPAKHEIKLIIVPHHLLASQYIADLIHQASSDKIKTVVIVGPNHENVGVRHLATTNAKWPTPYGELTVDQDLVKKFISDLKTDSEPSIFTNEHSIGAIAPFVQYYLPQSQILPIIFNSYSSARDVERVSNWLSENLPANSLVIVSTDFSHYLTFEQASQKDKITEQIILGRDLEKIFALNNDYVDSPASLALALSYAKQNNLATEIIHHNNSFNLLTVKPKETTSYFGIIFYP